MQSIALDLILIASAYRKRSRSTSGQTHARSTISPKTSTVRMSAVFRHADIEAVGYGDEKPVGPNDTKKERQKNRRIEASEIKAK